MIRAVFFDISGVLYQGDENEIAAEVTRLVPRAEFDLDIPEHHDPMRAPQV